MGWKVIKLESTLGEFCEDWDRLNRDLYNGQPFFESRFVDLSLQRFSNNNEHLCVHTSNENKVDGMLILYPKRFGIWTVFLPVQAQIAPVMVTHLNTLDSLFSVLPEFAMELELLNQDPLYSLATEKRDSLSTLRQQHVLTINVDIVDDFHDYWKGRSKNLQKNIKRYINRIEGEGKELRLTCHEEPGAIKEAVVRYGELESRGWKAQEGTAIHPDNKQGSFYLDLLHSFSTTGSAVVYELYIGDDLVGSRLCIYNNSIMIILKTAYDETCSKYAPGRLLLFFVLKSEFDKKRINSIEFYTNASKDQISWSTGQRDIEHILFFRNRILKYSYELIQYLREVRFENENRKKQSVEVQNESIICINKFNNFEDLSPEDKQIFKINERVSFDLGFEWFSNLSNAGIESLSDVIIYTAKNNKTAHSSVILPLLKSEKKRRLTSLSNYYTSLYSPIVASLGEEILLTDIFFQIRQSPESWSKIDLSPLDRDSQSFSLILDAFRSSGWVPFPYFCFGNWYLDVKGRSFDEYYQDLPSKLRSTLKRKGKKFQSQLQPEFMISKGEDQLDAFIADYEKIYASSWKKPEPWSDFISGFVKLCAKKGQLRLGLAYINGEPAAAQIWIVNTNKASIYKLAHDEKFYNLSVGSLLTEQMMKYVIDIDRVKEVDYLIGDDSYKQSWMSHRRERWGIIAYNMSDFFGFFGALNEITRRKIKVVLRFFSSNKRKSNY